MAVYAATLSIFSYVSGRFLLKKLGRKTLLISMVVSDAIYLTFALLWQPGPDNFYFLFLYFVLAGIVKSQRMIFFSSKYITISQAGTSVLLIPEGSRSLVYDLRIS